MTDRPLAERVREIAREFDRKEFWTLSIVKGPRIMRQAATLHEAADALEARPTQKETGE